MLLNYTVITERIEIKFDIFVIRSKYALLIIIYISSGYHANKTTSGNKYKNNRYSKLYKNLGTSIET